MKKHIYKPKPMELSEIELPAELRELIELLSENQHNIWAFHKIKAGFDYGPKTNAPQMISGEIVTRGSHPDLIPYSELSEEKKDVDRENVIGTLKAILKLGFKIVKSKEQS
jgi:hypothetical protein